MIDIRRATEETIALLWKVEDRRLDSERVVVRPKIAGFELHYKPLPGALWRVGQAERSIPEAEAWLDAEDRDLYFAWLDGALAGQMLVQTWENNLARVRDIRVDMTMRKRGVGEALLSVADEWARGKKLGGLVAETQDVNAGACQFLTRCDFELGGIDTLRYAANSQTTLQAAGLRESALFFYRFFR